MPPCSQPEVLVGAVRCDHLPRIHPVVRIEEPFHLAEGIDERAVEHAVQQFAPCLAVAVFPREGATVGGDEVGGAEQERAERGDPLGVREVERDACVHASLPKCPYSVGRSWSNSEKQPLQSAQVVAEPVRRYGGVLPGLPVVGRTRGHAQTRLASPEHSLFAPRVVRAGDRRVLGAAAERFEQFPRLRVHIVLAVPAELDEEPALPLGEGVQRLDVGAFLTHELGHSSVQRLPAVPARCAPATSERRRPRHRCRRSRARPSPRNGARGPDPVRRAIRRQACPRSRRARARSNPFSGSNESRL